MSAVPVPSDLLYPAAGSVGGGSSSGAEGVAICRAAPAKITGCHSAQEAMYGLDHRASTEGEIKPVSHPNPCALITFTEVVACILSPWKPLMLPGCCLCVWLIFKGKVASPVAELSAARGNRSPSPACILALPPRDKRKGRDGGKVLPVSNRPFQWIHVCREKGSGMEVLGQQMWGNQKAPPFYQNTSVFLQVDEPGIKRSPSFSDTFSNS